MRRNYKLQKYKCEIMCVCMSLYVCFVCVFFGAHFGLFCFVLHVVLLFGLF